MHDDKFRIPPFPPRLILPESFNECLSYGQRQWYMWKVIEQLQDQIIDLEERVEALEGQN